MFARLFSVCYTLSYSLLVTVRHCDYVCVSQYLFVSHLPLVFGSVRSSPSLSIFTLSYFSCARKSLPHLSFSPICLPFRLAVLSRLCFRRQPSGLCRLSPFWLTCLLSPLSSMSAVTPPAYMSVVTLPICVSAVTLLICVCCHPSGLPVSCHPSRLCVCLHPSDLCLLSPLQPTCLLSPFPATCLKSPFWSEIKCSISALEA